VRSSGYLFIFQNVHPGIPIAEMDYAVWRYVLEAIDGADGRDDLDAVIGSCCGDHVVARKRRCSALRYALDEPPHVRFPR
jgi:hypothetical protein